TAREPARVLRAGPAAADPVLGLADLAPPWRRGVLDPYGTPGPRRDRRATARDARADDGGGAHRDRDRDPARAPLGGPSAVSAGRPGAPGRPRRPVAPELLAGDADHRGVLALPAVAPEHRRLCGIRPRSAREPRAPSLSRHRAPVRGAERLRGPALWLPRSTDPSRVAPASRSRPARCGSSPASRPR